jgi:hypothetical protein
MHRFGFSILLVILSAFIAVGCGSPAEKEGELPDLGSKNESPRKFDTRMRGVLDTPLLSGVFTLRPDKAIMEVQRLQVSGKNDNVTVSCNTNVGSSQWWQIRIDTEKTLWQMRLRDGRDLDREYAEVLAGSPGCVLKASPLPNPIVMPIAPLQVQPLVYEGRAEDGTKYTLTLPASADLDGATLLADPMAGKGQLTCHQILGDAARSAQASGGALKPVQIPEGKKFKSKKARAAYLKKLRAAQAKKLAAGVTLKTVKAPIIKPSDAAADDPFANVEVVEAFDENSSIGSAMVPDPDGRGRDDLILVHGIVGQITSREPARLGGLWCGRYQGGKAFKAKFGSQARLEQVNVDVPDPAEDPEGMPARLAGVLNSSGALGVRIATDPLLIAKLYPQKPMPIAVIQSDDARTQLVNVQIFLYANAKDAKKGVALINKRSQERPALVMTACDFVAVGEPQRPATTKKDETFTPSDDQFVKLDQIKADLIQLCKDSTPAGNAKKAK